jgi:hypothetical protein
VLFISRAAAAPAALVARAAAAAAVDNLIHDNVVFRDFLSFFSSNS